MMGTSGRLLLLLAVAALLAPSRLPSCSADPTDGFTPVPLTERNFVLQKPYDVPLDQRYRFINGVRRLWVFDDDKPFQEGNPTKPRTEIRISGYDYSSGVWQFEGYGYVPAGTTGTSIVQIHRDSGSSSTEMMLRVYDGELRNYRTDVVATNVYDRWMRINVIHDVGANRVTVFIDNVQRLQVNGKGPSNFYFKCGVYTQNDPSHRMESWWRDIKIYRRGT